MTPSEATAEVLRLTTWNLRGRSRPDLEAVAEELERIGADVIALQEVQRRQTEALASHLGYEHVWRLKHWPIPVPAEGLAVMSRLGMEDPRVVVLARRWIPWSSRRRIALSVDLSVEADLGRRLLRVVDVHLGSGVGDDERTRQARLVRSLVEPAELSVVAGDFNTRPGSSVVRELSATGHRDAWEECRPGAPGPTNWRAGPRHGPPAQRLDYVMVGPGIELVEVTVPAHGEPGFARYGQLSDHLPVTVTLSMTDR
jgi:endonuclease/exonuclease/phosphatase family metal-dependent hydrolase